MPLHGSDLSLDRWVNWVYVFNMAVLHYLCNPLPAGRQRYSNPTVPAAQGRWKDRGEDRHGGRVGGAVGLALGQQS